MAQLGDYDPEQKPEQRDLLPVNIEYPAMIVDSDKKEKSGDPSSTWLELNWLILEGPYENRHVFQKCTWDNKSDIAVRIGRGQFSAVRRACNVLSPRDTAELHNIPCIIKLGVEKGTGTFPDKNVVTAVYGRDADGNKVTPAQMEATQAPPAPAAPAARAAAPAAPRLAPTATGKPAWGAPRPAAAKAPS